MVHWKMKPISPRQDFALGAHFHDDPQKTFLTVEGYTKVSAA
jgi:hypothetical protein